MSYTYRAIYRLLDAKRRRHLWGLVALMFVASLLNFLGVALVLPFLSLLAEPGASSTREGLAWVVDLLGDDDHLATLNVLGLIVFASIVAALVSQAAVIFLSARFGRRLAHSLAVRRLEVYLSQPYEWFATRHSAELSKSLLDEVNQVVSISIQPALRVVANGFVCVMLIGLLVAIEPLGAIVMAAALGGAFILVYFGFSQSLRTMGVERKAANRERFQVAGEILGGIKEVKVMGLEGAYLRRFFKPSHRIANYQARLTVIGEFPRIGVEALTFGGMMLFTLYLLQVRGADVGEIVPVLGAFALAGIRLMPTAQILFRDVSQMRFGEAALRSLEHDLVADRPTLADRRTEGPDLAFDREIRLDAVTYTYPQARGPAVEELSLRIPAGSSVGIVGATGAGKTTVTDILLGLVQPQKGAFTVDGTPVTAGNAKAWQRHIGYVPQSVRLIDDSIARNIDRSATDRAVDLAAVERAARLASLHDFVATLPDGYDTRVGDAGVKLSGGQLQRIGIARALLRNPDVLVFDEATSALDPVTERAVMDALRALHGTKTLIIISHRIRTLAFCDTIFVLDRGKLADQGTYAELEAVEGSFQEMLAAMR
jgi:ABC-type multidrug transport system fused ATPase/permease subunit